MRECRRYEVDVLVVGGGSAGAVAGIAAARQGLRTLVVESRESLGGYATNGYVHGVDGPAVGIGGEWIERLNQEGDVVPKSRFAMNIVFDPERGKLMFERMLLQAGAKLLYGVNVVDCETQDNMITKVIAYGKSGRLEIKAKMYIDASGDADLAEAAGVPYETGANDFAGFNQGSTQVFRLSHVNRVEFNAANAAWMKEKETNPALKDKLSYVGCLYEKAVENGDLPYFIWPTALFYPLPHTSDEDADVTVNSAHSTCCRSTDVEDRTRQILEQHQQVIFLERFLKKYVPGFQNCNVTNITSMHGFRETRRVMGEYVFTDQDLACGAKFEDAICQFTGNFDTHHPTSRKIGFLRHIHMDKPKGSAVCQAPECYGTQMHPLVELEGVEARVHPLDYCEIPYRVIVPQKIDNLLMAGRCVSAQSNASAATRVIGNCMSTGQAAATAAKLCIEAGCSPRQLDGRLVKQALIEQGIALDQAPAGFGPDIVARQDYTLFLRAGDSVGFSR